MEYNLSEMDKMTEESNMSAMEKQNDGATRESKKENQYQNNNNSQNYNRGRGKGHNRNINYSSGQPYNWKGMNTNFGLILALKSERYEHKSLYSVFIERLKNHAIQEFTHGNDIVSLIENYEDPKDAINAQLPKDTKTKHAKPQGKKVAVKSEEVEGDDTTPEVDVEFSDEDELSDDVQSMMIKELVKNHINRITKLDMNKMKLYGLIWGQLTTGL